MFVERMRTFRERMLAAAERFRMDHGLRIDPDGWPARLYLRAYAVDRASWLGVPAAAKAEIDREAAERFPEVAAHVALEKRRHALYGPGEDWHKHSEVERKEFMRWHAASRAAADAVLEPWLKVRYATWHEERAREVRERFDAARQSLCPFFWSVVIAVVFYLGLIPAKRAIGRALRAAGSAVAWLFNLIFGRYSRAIGRGALATCVLALFFIGTTYREKIGDGLVWMTMGTYHTGETFVGWVASRPSAWVDTWSRWEQENFEKERIVWRRHLSETWRKSVLKLELAKRSRRAAEMERRERERQLAFKRDHPEALAAYVRQEAEVEREWRRWQVDLAQREADVAFAVRIKAIHRHARFLEDLPWKVFAALGITFAFLAFVAVLIKFEIWWGWLTTAFAFVLALWFMGLERFAIGRGILTVLDFFLRLPGVLLGALGAFLRGLWEGIVLLGAFGLACIRGVCPMLIPVRKDRGAQRL